MTKNVPMLQAVTVMVAQVPNEEGKENKGVIYLNMEVGDVKLPVELRPKPVFEGDVATGFTYRRLVKFLDDNNIVDVKGVEFDAGNIAGMVGKRFVIPEEKPFDFPGYFFIEKLDTTMRDDRGREFKEVRGVCIGVRAVYEMENGVKNCVQEAVGESPTKVVERLAKKFGWTQVGKTADAGKLETEDPTVKGSEEDGYVEGFAPDDDSIEAQMARLRAKQKAEANKK